MTTNKALPKPDTPPHSLRVLREGTPTDWPKIEELIRARPTHFIEAALPDIRSDFERGRTTVLENNGRILGFVIWKTDGRELELLWLAVAPHAAHTGVGRRIVEAVISHLTTEVRVFLKTAALDSTIPGTNFSGAAFASTHLFFAALGFSATARLDDYWGKGSHMLIFEKQIRPSDHRESG